MEEEDLWIFCVGKSWKKRTGGYSMLESHERRGLERRGLVDTQCWKVMKEEDWWIFCAVKSWKKRTSGSST
jgi:hypothetical protein